ncbi:class I SAM-dependent methyltransferase [Luteolibacter algae]|uniref:Class I SAM-dependent methyltransferase n=1 Tax=Luteolibacter algae TaxID=454151 RepID=A0ABW5D5C3_9BACT
MSGGEKKVGRLRLELFPRAEAAVRSGHPWVYGDSIKKQNRQGATGELAVMYDKRDRFLAVGLYEAESPIRVRILHCGKPAMLDHDWWLEKARLCLSKREEQVLGSGTDGARMINGESEGFPGIVADRYGDTLVVKVYAAGWFALWEEIEAVFREVFAPQYLVLRMSRNIVAKAKEYGLEEGFRGEAGAEIVVFSENGIRFESAVLRGQKTGFFLDQRDNRSRVEQLAKGRDVLNVFSFSGGFSLYAARGGADSVTDLDISAHALESAARNFSLNSSDPRIAQVTKFSVQADAFRWMEEDEKMFDLIIVDPPSLAKRESQREGAVRAYTRLNSRAMERLKPGGVLVAASCSAHVSAEEFHTLVEQCIQADGRRWRELWRHGHAPDHPANFREAEYLKAVCLEMI